MQKGSRSRESSAEWGVRGRHLREVDGLSQTWISADADHLCPAPGAEGKAGAQAAAAELWASGFGRAVAFPGRVGRVGASRRLALPADPLQLCLLLSSF